VKVRLLSPAIDEISEAALWFDKKRPGLGNEFWRATDETLEQIECNPRRFAKSEFSSDDIEIRFAVIRRFNYVIHFALDAQEIQIVSVAHAGRRPGHWLRRIRTGLSLRST
jgi:hypothetical protein